MGLEVQLILCVQSSLQSWRTEPGRRLDDPRIYLWPSQLPGLDYLVMYNGEWKENCNGSVLLSRSTASDSLKYCFPTMFLLPFLTSTGHSGCSGEDESPLTCRRMIG